jgi:hypothetical protein
MGFAGGGGARLGNLIRQRLGRAEYYKFDFLY